MSLLDNLKKIKNAAQLATTAAEGTNPVGWAMIIAKYRKQIMKAMAAGIGLFILLLLALWQKFVGAAFGLGFGAITGLPLLLVPGVGPFLYVGWTAFWTYRGWTHPEQTIHLATHPWEAITTPLSKAWGYISSGISKGWNYSVSHLEGIPNAVGSTISGGLSGFGHMVTGFASAAFNTVVGWGGSLLSGLVDISSSALGYLTGATGAVAGQIAAVAVGTTIASAATMAILNAGILTPGKFATTQTDKGQNIIPPPGSAYLTVTKTATPSTLQNSDLPKTINFEVIVSSKSVKLINVTCEDLTTLVKSDGSTVPLTITPTPSCPSTIDANSQVKFNFTTQADNTPAFQNASIVNVFNVYYDIAQLALGSCSTGSGFANLLPNPIPPSAGAVSPSSFSTLDSGQVVPAAIYGAQKSGVACELLVGIDFVEDTWNDQRSFINGGPISQVYPVPNAGLCAAYNGTWIEGSGCQIDTLPDVAYYAGNVIKDKMADFMFLGWRPPANFQEMVGAMSHYNGGGNHNCNNFVSVAYSGPCPAPYYGNDDAYAMTHFDSPHQTMYIFYCQDGVFCNPPYANTRDGAATAAKEYYLRRAGP